MTLPALAQETILLRPNDKVDPNAPAEKIEERGKGGVVDRAISNVVAPTCHGVPAGKGKGEWNGDRDLSRRRI